MNVTELDESTIQAIGHAFGFYDYGPERGLADAFPSRDATATYICGYVRMALQSGLLHTTGPRGEGYIAYRLPGEKVSLKAVWQLARGMFAAMNLKQMGHFFGIMLKGGQGLEDRMKKKKKPYIFVGMVCVLEQYQGQGYMRKLLDMAFAEGNRLQVPRDPGHRRQIQMRQVHPPGHAPRRHPPLRPPRRPLRPDQIPRLAFSFGGDEGKKD